MRAMVVTGGGGGEGGWGQRLALREVARPEPGAGQILVRVRAAGVDPDAWRGGRWRRLPRLAGPPRIPGVEIAGEVVAVGPEVADFEPGDAVCAVLDRRRGGGYAEYAVAGCGAAILMPEALSFEEAAALPAGGLTALQGLRDAAGLQAGEHVAVGGAGGGLGHLAVQIAAAMGARVTAVAAPPALDLVRRLGAERAVDLTREDFTALAAVRPLEPAADGVWRGPRPATGGVRPPAAAAVASALAADGPYVSYEVIFDAGGDLSFGDCEAALAAGGIFVTTRRGVDVLVARLRGGLARRIDRGEARRAAAVSVRVSGTDLALLAQLVEAGRLRPVIDRVFALDEAAAAHAAAAAGLARGGLVLRLGPAA
jgi:NADPH:quinone reductase-like Zn-dependent oxidoreductase